MSNPTWADVTAWAKAEIEDARGALETEADISAAIRLRARCAVLRDLQRLNQKPIAAQIPGPVAY